MMNNEYIDKYLRETEEIIKEIDREQINNMIEILFYAWKNGKKVITMGNGGSASTSSHFAADLAKTVANDSSMDKINTTKGFKAICLNDNISVLSAWINDTGWENAYAGLLNTLLEEGDVILLVSVHGGSGWSGNLAKAMQVARKRGTKIIGLSGFDGGMLKEMADCCIVIPKNSTPHVEGFHLVVQHLIVDRLRELIGEYSKEHISIDIIREIIQNDSGELTAEKFKELLQKSSNEI